MNAQTLELTCRDAIVSRDGRPFGAGQGLRMRSHRWPLPSVVAGSCRTMIGKVAAKDFSAQVATELLNIEVSGLFPVAEQTLYLPAPLDCVSRSDKKLFQMKPMNGSEGDGNWPMAGLQPVVISDAAVDDFKPIFSPAWWPVEKYALWLSNPQEMKSFDESFLLGPEPEDRFHAKLNSETGTAAEGELFMSSALPLSRLKRYEADWADVALSVRVQATDWAEKAVELINVLHPLGGERRLVHWKTEDKEKLWECPDLVTKTLNETSNKNIRMVLATPALFRDGWKPGWLNDRLEGTPPGTGISMKLIGVTISHWQAVSGWSLAEPRGPKPVRRMVPAGGVYFFQLLHGQSSDLKKLWLESVSDEEQDRRDGFGLATWGIW